MKWESTFTLPGRPTDVMRQFTDVERMAQYLPGAAIDGRDEDGSYRGTITVSFGPKRIIFRGKMTQTINDDGRSGVLVGQGASDQRAARFKVRVTYAVQDAPNSEGSSATLVTLTSDAELQGVLADFAHTGGPAVAKVILDEFAKRFAAGASATASPAPVAPRSISGFTLIARMIPELFASWLGRLRAYVSGQSK